MSNEIDVIVNIISPLELKAALGYLVAQKIFDFSKVEYAKLKKIIIDKQNEGKFAFVPNKEEAIKLKQAADSPDYKIVKMLIAHYSDVDLIRTGLLVKYYQQNSEAYNDRIREIKTQIARRPNGAHLMKIVNLPTTPFFSVILNHLYELKKQGYSAELLAQAFDEIVLEWEKATLFVKTENTQEEVINFCKGRLSLKGKFFFVLGMGNAAEIVVSAFNSLDSERVLEKYRYVRKVTTSGVGSKKKVEVACSYNDENYS